MADFKFKESIYKFTDPVRLFKANDPYYWEVDNIPLAQLNENDLWLKDQLTQRIEVTDVLREDIAELKPYVNGNDNILRVKPGRYTARINDAYQLTPLQTLTNILGEGIGEVDVYTILTNNATAVQSTWERLQSAVATDALNLNGLIERSQVYAYKDSDNLSRFLSPPTITTLLGIGQAPHPIAEAQLPIAGENTTELTNYTYFTPNADIGFTVLGVLDTNMVKRWRGVARTAVVDVPNELEIEIPAFDPNDWWYKDTNGNRQTLTAATQRVDLLFVYSHPIDVSATHVAKWVDRQPTKITKAELGIVKGAGLGLDFQAKANVANQPHVVSATTSDGISQILGHIADEQGGNGFTKLNIKGSFPSPDDLMNVTPALVENLADDNLALVGQTILPLAYVRISETASVNSAGQPVLQGTDIVDIRPFFRTTELSYNERAGIAAATPALSFANPAVGKAQMDWELRRLFEDYVGRINQIGTTAGGATHPRMVGGGFVKGGANFGVEGAIMHFLRDRFFNAGTSNERLKQELINRHGFPTTYNVPDFPDWDLSRWATAQGVASIGASPNDYVNVVHSYRKFGQNVEWGPFEDTALGTRLKKFGTDNITGQDGHFSVYYVKKTINIDRTSVQWMDDYLVNVQLWNCVPLSSRAFGPDPMAAAGAHGVWIDKQRNQFTIHVAWVVNDFFPTVQTGSEWLLNTALGAGGIGRLPHDNREGHWYAGFAVISEDMFSAANSSPSHTGEPPIGVAIYPTVSFEVVGIPSGFAGYNLNLNGLTPTINLE
jgi:hypothetical protein